MPDERLKVLVEGVKVPDRKAKVPEESESAG